MARIGLSPCRIAVVLMLSLAGHAPADDQAQAIAATLAVQDAMRQGRDLLQRGQVRTAVDVLEAQLTRINGNPSYLALLREAYSAYVKELQLSRQDDLYDTYRQRLLILDKTARTDPPPAKPEIRNPKSEIRTPDDDPLQQTPRRHTPTGRELLPAAEKAFAEKRYHEADELFGRAYGADTVAPDHAPQWAYSKLNSVVARLQNPDATPTTDLETEVATALRLAVNNPELDTFGRKLLESIRQRGTGPTPTASVAIQHHGQGQDGWARAESANFRLFHNQPREFAEQLLRAAEQARTAAFEKWAGPPRGDWSAACEIFLHATAADYVRNTKKEPDSPGHATYEVNNGAVTRRRLNLRADEPNTLSCVVPHETTHLVLAGLFADAPLPRWADEAMAVLAEPRAQIDRYGRTLHTCQQQRQLLPLAQVLGRADYPDKNHITAFYVESVSVVEFLVAEKGENGPRAFTQFLRDAQKVGLEPALAKHYGSRTVAELEVRWLRWVARPAAEPGVRTAGHGGP